MMNYWGPYETYKKKNNDFVQFGTLPKGQGYYIFGNTSSSHQEVCCHLKPTMKESKKVRT
jgi:hypothetical protein